MRCEGFCEFGNVKWGCVGNGKWVCVLEVGQSDEVEFMMSVILSFSIVFLLLKDPQSLIDHQAINYDYRTSYQIQETATVHMMWLCYLSSVVNNPTGQTSKIVEERVSIVLEHSHSVKVIQHLAKYMAPKAILMLRMLMVRVLFFTRYIQGFEVFSIFHPQDEVINSVVIARKCPAPTEINHNHDDDHHHQLGQVNQLCFSS
ncbi:nicotianamine synthase-like protein [Tanacetum coccineum]